MALPYIEAELPFKSLRQLLHSGELGDVSYIRVRTAIPGPEDYYRDVRQFYNEPNTKFPYHDEAYARKRGCLSDMGVYALAAFHYLVGKSDFVHCTRSSSEYERAAVTILLRSSEERKTSLIGCVEAGWSQIGSTSLVSIFGSKRTVTMLASGDISIHGDVKYSKALQQEKGRASALLPMSPITGQRAWINAIHRKTKPQFLGTLERAMWISDVLDQAYGEKE
jgi:predicted dehydrogenase